MTMQGREFEDLKRPSSSHTVNISNNFQDLTVKYEAKLFDTKNNEVTIDLHFIIIPIS